MLPAAGVLLKTFSTIPTTQLVLFQGEGFCRLKVLDINNLYSPTGGGIRTYHHEKFKWCQKNGIQNLLLYPSSRNCSVSVHGGTVTGLKSPGLAGSGYHFFTRGEPVRKALRRFDPDIVELGSGIVVPGMVSRELEDIISCAFYHSNWPETLPMSVLGLTGGVFQGVFRKITMPLMKKSYSRLNTVFGASDHVMKTLSEAGLENTVKVPLGTNPDVFHPGRRSEELRRSLGVSSGSRMILFMGRLAPEKGIHVLLKACSRLLGEKNLVLVIAGEGHWDKRVRKMTALNPGKIKMIDRVTGRKQAAELMASADAFISAGPLETFSLATLEALCCGTPVAACNRGAASELVLKAGGKTVYAPWDSGYSLAEAVLEAVETGSSQRDQLRSFACRYTWDTCFESIFSTCLKGNR